MASLINMLSMTSHLSQHSFVVGGVLFYLFVLMGKSLDHIPPGLQHASVCEGSVRKFCLTVSCHNLLFVMNEAPW